MSWTLAIERSPLSMLLSAVGCGMVGLPCGLLLWLGAADFPEETIRQRSSPGVPEALIDHAEASDPLRIRSAAGTARRVEGVPY